MRASKRPESDETRDFQSNRAKSARNLQRNRHGNAAARLDTPKSRVLASFPCYRRTFEQMVRFSFEHNFKESYPPLAQGGTDWFFQSGA